MAKIQVYKFVSPAVGQSSTTVVAAAKQSLLATNRLGKTVTGLGREVVDINKLTSLKLKTLKKADILERRQKQRQIQRQ